MILHSNSSLNFHKNYTVNYEKMLNQKINSSLVNNRNDITMFYNIVYSTKLAIDQLYRSGYIKLLR